MWEVAEAKPNPLLEAHGARPVTSGLRLSHTPMGGACAASHAIPVATGRRGKKLACFAVPASGDGRVLPAMHACPPWRTSVSGHSERSHRCVMMAG